MSYTGFRLTGANAVAIRPADKTQTVAGETWARDKSSPAADDGTEIDATWVNRVRANLEGLVLAAGGSLTAGDNQLANAITLIINSIATKAPIASPTFTGVPTAPTGTTGANTAQIANQAFVIATINALINAAPGALDTLDELAAALGDDANFAATMTTALATKLVKASNLSDLTDAAAARTNLGLAIGTNVQAYNARLAELAGMSWQTGDLSYYDGANLVRLPAGTNGYYLKANGAGTPPSYAAPPAGGFGGTSPTAVTVGTGTKTFNDVETTLAWLAGHRITAAAASGAAHMTGYVVSYSAGTLVIEVDATAGSGSVSTWKFQPARGAAGSAGAGAPYSEANALANGDGADGNIGFDTLSGHAYPGKASGVWPAPFELGLRVEMPAGATAHWVASDYDATLKAIPNRIAGGSLQPVLTRYVRGAFGSNAATGSADGWLSTGQTVTEKFAAGRDGVVAATRILSTSAGSGSVRWRQTFTLPAGTYTMVIDVKSNTGVDQDFLMSKDGGSTSVTKTATTTMQQFKYEFTLGGSATFDGRFCYPTGGGHTMDFVIDKAFLWEGNAASVPADLIQRGDMLLGLHAKDTAVTMSGAAFDTTGGKVGSAEFPAFMTISGGMTWFVVVKRTQAYVHTSGYRQIWLFNSLESNTGGSWSLGEFEGTEGYFRAKFVGLTCQNPTNMNRSFLGEEYYVVSARYGQHGLDLWVDDVCFSATPTGVGVPPVTTGRLFQIGIGNATTGARFAWAAGAMYSRALDDDERRQAIRALKRDCMAAGLTVVRPKNYLVAGFDSITLGPSNNSYVHKYLPNASQTVFIRNEAAGGSQLTRNGTAALNLSRRWPFIIGSIPPREKDRYGRRFIVTLLPGANDLQPAYNDVDDFLAELGGFCDQAKMRGAVVGLATILPKGTAASGYATHNTLRAAANTRLRQWIGWRCDFIIDLAANANIGGDAAANNATYYNADGIHLTDAGHIEAEIDYRAAVNAWLLA